MPDFRRKQHRLSPESYFGRKAHFLTLCTHERKKVLVDPDLAGAIVSTLRKACADHSFGVYAFCIMPDHLHLILTGQSESSDLQAVVTALKGSCAASARQRGIRELWQKGFYDHVLRTGESMDAAAWYVFLNPVRAGLVKRADEWQFSGSFVFPWKKLPAVVQPYQPPWKANRLA